MFGRNDAKARPTRAAKAEATPRNGHEPAAAPSTLLTIVGQQSRVEGKFEIADSIQIECEVGGELTVGGKLVIGEHGVVTADVHTVDAVSNVAKIREHDAMSGPRPVHLVDDKRVGAQK